LPGSTDGFGRRLRRHGVAGVSRGGVPVRQRSAGDAQHTVRAGKVGLITAGPRIRVGWWAAAMATSSRSNRSRSRVAVLARSRGSPLGFAPRGDHGPQGVSSDVVQLHGGDTVARVSGHWTGASRVARFRR